MKYKLKVYSIWEFGQRKDADGNPHQEDSTFPMPGELNDSDRTFILCDGMGGHDAGEVASATVCEAMGESILNDGHDAEGVFTDDDLKAAVAAAFDALDQKDSGAEKKMGTTMTFLKLHNDGVTIAHMGDSRVYHIRPGEDGATTQILFETRDHSLINDLIRIGEMTREEARTSRQKNVITRAMQPNMERRPRADVHHITDIKAGDYFYMCSDGMLEQPDMESGETLRNIFSRQGGPDERRVNILKDVTENNRDNHTALIIHIEEVTGAPTRPAETSTPRMATVDDSPAKGARIAAPKGAGDGNAPRTNMIARFLIMAVVVAACLVCVKYVPSCSDNDEGERTEMPAKGKKQPSTRKDAKKDAGDEKKSEETQPEKPQPEKPQEQTSPQAGVTDSRVEDAATRITSDNSGAIPSDQQKISETTTKPLEVI